MVVEAAALGTPTVVIESPDNAARELVVDGENGVVARSAEPQELADAILRVHAAGAELRSSTAAWFRRNRKRLSLESTVERASTTSTGGRRCASGSTSFTSSPARPAAGRRTSAGSCRRCSRRAGPATDAFAASEAYALDRAEPWAREATIVRVPVRARSRPRRVLAEQTLLPRAARRARIELAAQHAQYGARVPRCPAGDDDSRRDLQALSGDRRPPERGRRAARTLGRPPLSARADGLGGFEAATSSTFSQSSAIEST